MTSYTNQEMADNYFIYGVADGNALDSHGLYGNDFLLETRLHGSRPKNFRTLPSASRKNRFVCQWDARHRAYQECEATETWNSMCCVNSRVKAETNSNLSIRKCELANVGS
ncbi:hypothetical protein TNIN_41501 [Trichonephila inaurata madagascariensis]|uniref:Uncharacterized protein n=1 Tax=Trichonephila inaurata madagascariensis TaxID=2747483 RepID=A0A8X7CK80_9ARAC|nr:hypothetical protein TNIN_41501 [Trichonephila inaurata madagascariensis]